MGLLRFFARLRPKSLEGQLVAVVALSQLLLLVVLTGIEVAQYNTTAEWAESDAILGGLRRMRPVFDSLSVERVESFLELSSSCHRGYSVTSGRFPRGRHTAETLRLEAEIADKLALNRERVSVVQATLTRDDFSYAECTGQEFDRPVEGIVVGVELESGLWLNAEVHPHEWHAAYMLGWLARTAIAVLFVGGIAILLMRRLSRPLAELTDAARRFGQRLQPLEVGESGPPDLQRAIRAFNTMQGQVTGEVTRRANTLAAMSHDLRTPLTALRIKAELVDDEELRRGLIESIGGLERLAASALEYLKGESESEPMRRTDLKSLVESECDNFVDLGLGAKVVFISGDSLLYECRPDALARALRNLIENAIKYGGGATIALLPGPHCVEIEVTDEGPGIPRAERVRALEPFERLSSARESSQGGFGVGLAVAKAVCEGHKGELVLTSNDPSGLVATMRLPVSAAVG